jgi:drug/metabolite transporter (DMT)-like permease
LKKILISAAPYLALATSVIVLTLSSFFVRWANAPGTITSFYRMVFASLILTPVFLSRKTKISSFRWQVLVFPLLAGLCSALDHSIWSTAIGLTRVANATLLNNIAPLWVALVAVLFWREKLGRIFWIGLFLAMAGAVVVFGNDLVANPHLSVGDGLGILSSVAYAGFFITVQRGRKFLDTLTFTWLEVIFCTGFLLIVNLLIGRSFTGYSFQTYLVFMAAGLVSQVIGYFSLTYALGHVPAAIVSPTMIGQPVLTALLAIPILGEKLMTVQWIGGLAVLAGIFLVNRSQDKQKPSENIPLPS